MSREEIKKVIEELLEKQNNLQWLKVNGILFQIKDDINVIAYSGASGSCHIYIITKNACVAYIPEYAINDISFEEAE